jgi:hypothetical protein
MSRDLRNRDRIVLRTRPEHSRLLWHTGCTRSTIWARKAVTGNRILITSNNEDIALVILCRPNTVEDGCDFAKRDGAFVLEIIGDEIEVVAVRVGVEGVLAPGLHRLGKVERVNDRGESRGVSENSWQRNT